MDFDAEGDGLDEFIKAGTRQTPDEEFVASGREHPELRGRGLDHRNGTTDQEAGGSALDRSSRPQ